MRSTVALICAVVLMAVAPGVAQADSSSSSNWSGYVAHRGGVSFRRVSAGWTQPSVSCTPGLPTYSAVWVGLGGFSETSPALEQIGTEVDCNATGQTVSSAWYELVPSPTKSIRLTVAPGDAMHASVQVVGDGVTLALADDTRHTSFTKAVKAATVDISSADWILEAPSECISSYECRALPLADFGSVHFSGARAMTKSGRRGSVSSGLWGTTKITLATVLGGRRYVDFAPIGGATPMALIDGGSAFAVDYLQPAVNPVLFGRESAASAAPAKGTVAPGGLRRPHP